MSEKTDLVLGETATALDKILNAICPPPYDPYADPTKTVFAMNDGSTKVLDHVVEMEGDSEVWKFYLEGEAEPQSLGSSFFSNVRSIKVGTEVERYLYQSSGATFLNDYSNARFPNLESLTIERLGLIEVEGHMEREVFEFSNYSHLSSVQFPTEVSAQIQLKDVAVKSITFPLGNIGARYSGTSYTMFEDCQQLTSITFPSSGYLKTFMGTYDPNNPTAAQGAQLGTGNYDYNPETGEMVPVPASITIPQNLTCEFSYGALKFWNEITFEGRTKAEVEAMVCYPWFTGRQLTDYPEWPSGVTGHIHCTDGDIDLYDIYGQM